MQATAPQKSRLRNTRDTAKDFFGKSERWLWEQSQPRGPIPCIRVGKSVLYDWQQLEQWLAEQQAASVVDDIRTLHEICTPVSEIASKLHLPESTIRHVIETGSLPEAQPHWKPSTTGVAGGE